MKKYDITNWQARITELSRIDHIQQQPELAYQLAYCYIVGNQVDHALSLLHGLEQTIDSQPPTAVLTDELKVKIYLELAACYIKKNDFSQSDQYFVKMTDISSTLENFSHYENVILIETLFEKRRDKEFFDLLSIRNDLNESLESFEIPEDLQDYEQYAKSAKLLDDPMREAQVKLYLSMLDTDAYYIIKNLSVLKIFLDKTSYPEYFKLETGFFIGVNKLKIQPLDSDKKDLQKFNNERPITLFLFYSKLSGSELHNPYKIMSAYELGVYYHKVGYKERAKTFLETSYSLSKDILFKKSNRVEDFIESNKNIIDAYCQAIEVLIEINLEKNNEEKSIKYVDELLEILNSYYTECNKNQEIHDSINNIIYIVEIFLQHGKPVIAKNILSRMECILGEITIEKKLLRANTFFLTGDFQQEKNGIEKYLNRLYAKHSGITDEYINAYIMMISAIKKLGDKIQSDHAQQRCKGPLGKCKEHGEAYRKNVQEFKKHFQECEKLISLLQDKENKSYLETLLKLMDNAIDTSFNGSTILSVKNIHKYTLSKYKNFYIIPWLAVFLTSKVTKWDMMEIIMPLHKGETAHEKHLILEMCSPFLDTPLIKQSNETQVFLYTVLAYCTPNENIDIKKSYL